MNPQKMTAEELALVLRVNEKTIKGLAKTEQIPCIRKKTRVYFSLPQIVSHFKNLEENNRNLVIGIL